MNSPGNPASQEELYTLCYVIADDDEEELMLMRMALSQQQKLLPIREFADGQHVIDYLKWNEAIQGDEDTHWLLVLDMNMPLLNGLETVKVIRQNADWNTIPILLFVDSQNQSLVHDALASGANGCITKPKSLEEYGQLFDQFFKPYLR